MANGAMFDEQFGSGSAGHTRPRRGHGNGEHRRYQCRRKRRNCRRAIAIGLGARHKARCYLPLSALHAKLHGRRTIDHEARTPETPGNAIIKLSAIQRHVALVVLAEAAAAVILSAAVAITDDVLFAVERM